MTSAPSVRCVEIQECSLMPVCYLQPPSVYSIRMLWSISGEAIQDISMKVKNQGQALLERAHAYRI
jgi:hypothetical protein